MKAGWNSLRTALKMVLSGFIPEILVVGKSTTCWMKKRPVFVDGVDIIRDRSERVVACIDRDEKLAPKPHEWFYTYQSKGLVSVEGPEIRRQIALDDRGRVLGWRGDGFSHEFSYDPLWGKRGCQTSPRKHFTGILWVESGQ